MPSDEAAELEQEANENDKSRSAYLRSLIRSRHIEEQLEEQVLTKEDQRQYEQRIHELKKEKERLEIKLETANNFDSTIEDAVERSFRTVKQSYETQIEQLEAENKELRSALDDLSDAVVTQKQWNVLVTEVRQTLEEESQKTHDKVADGRVKVNETTETCRDEIIEEVKRTRPLRTKLIDWVRSVGHRIKIFRSKRKIR